MRVPRSDAPVAFAISLAVCAPPAIFENTSSCTAVERIRDAANEKLICISGAGSSVGI